MQLGNLAFLSGIFSSTSSNHASHMSRLSFAGKARRRLGGKEGSGESSASSDLGSFLVAGYLHPTVFRWGFFGKFLDESGFPRGGFHRKWSQHKQNQDCRMSIWMRPEAIQVTRPRKNSYPPFQNRYGNGKSTNLKTYSRIFHCHVSFRGG